MKRITSFLLVFAMLLSMAPAVFAAELEQPADATEINEEIMEIDAESEDSAADETAGEAATEETADQGETEVPTQIDANTVWSYLDDNTDPAGDASAADYNRTCWTAENFDDSAWKTGAGPFSNRTTYQTGYQASTLLDGCDAQNDYPAYFFRTEIRIDSLDSFNQLQGTVEYDDGVIIYINGVRVAIAGLGDNEITQNLQYGGDSANQNPNTADLVVTDLSMLHEGVNTVAVELHQIHAASSDLWFRMTLSGVQVEIPEATAQTNVSLSVGADQTQMNFTWYADTFVPGSLLVAKNDALVDGAMPADAAEFEASAAVTNEGLYSNKVTVTGLEAGTTYAYQLVNGNLKSDIRTFTTDDGGEFSFAFVADPQIGASGNNVNDGNGWDKTLNIVAENEIFSDVSFLLSAGDQVNTASSEEQYDLYLDHNALLNLPVATIIGNHDSSSDAYAEHFNIANNSGLGSTTAGGDYWFTYNNVLFMVINTNSTSVAEHLEFAQNAIAANPDASWKVVTFHHSVYTVASHALEDSIINLRNTIAPLMKELDIDVVLMGHDHVYCRTYMMDGLTPMTDASIYDDENYSSITNPEGVLYVTANSGSGSKHYNIQNADFPYAAVQNQEKVPNVSKVTVSDEQFTITTYRTTDMTVVDTFTINRTASEEEVPTEITADTEWKYLDDNTDPAGDPTAEGYVRTSWTAEDFDDEAWKVGVGPFGAQASSSGVVSSTVNGYEAATVLENCTKVNGSTIPTYYFRTYLQVDSLENVKSLVGTLEYDDVVFIYINGQKVYEVNNIANDSTGKALDEDGDGVSDPITSNSQYGGTNGGTQITVDLALGEDAVAALHEGVNTIAVELHNNRNTSSDIWFNMTLALSDEEIVEPSVQTDISLSMGSDESKMNFTWYAPTNEPGTLLVAKYDELVDGKMPANAPRFEATATEANDGNYSNQVTAINLEAGTTYAYQLVNGEDYSAIMTFTTGEAGAFTFAYVGDPQIGAGGSVVNDTNGWDNTLNIVAENEIFSDIAFMLSAGDQVNTASDENQYDGYLNHDALLSLPVATVIGNHDSSSDAYNEHFNLANESTEYGITNAGGDSWFVYNNVLFMVLNSNDQSAAEHKAFMEAAIVANPDVSWKIVTFHHSLYTVASHSYDSDILSRRDNLVPIFTELDIDVVLMGHDHVYCRSYMMNGLTPMTDAAVYDDENYSSVTDPIGILYVTANSGSGSKTYNIKNAVFEYSAVQNQEHVANVSKISVSDEQFTITTYRTTDMTVVDTFTINRTDAAGKVEELIEAIGEVTVDSAEAIEAARNAYDALTEDQKENVENYQTLLDAEHKFVILKAEAAQAATEAAQAAAETARAEAEAARAAAEAAAAEAAEDKTAAETAAQIAQEGQLKAEEAQAAAETAQAAAEAAAQAAEESNVEAAQKAGEAADSAAKAAESAASAAASASASADACLKAQQAQAAAEAAQKAAEEAAAKAEQDRLAAEKAEQEAKAAQEAAEAAAAQAQLALDRYNALIALDEYAQDVVVTNSKEAAAADQAVAAAREAINTAENAEEVTAALEQAKAALAEISCASVNYTDVPAEGWAHEAVDYALRSGLMKGDGVSKFNPNGQLTRGMMVQILYNLEGNPTNEAACLFSDVSANSYCYDAVIWAADNGIVEGFGNGEFRPNDLLTREQMVTILWRYAGKPETAGDEITFADAADVSNFAVEAVIWAAENGIVNGIGGNKFAPADDSTRAQAAKVMMVFNQLVK